MRFDSRLTVSGKPGAIQTVEKLSTGKGKISSAILPVIKPGNVTALSIFQGAALHFDNANKSSSVAHLRGAQ